MCPMYTMWFNLHFTFFNKCSFLTNVNSGHNMFIKLSPIKECYCLQQIKCMVPFLNTIYVDLHN